MYDSWSNFARTGSTYSYLEYKKMQRHNKKVNSSNSSEGGDMKR